MSASIERAADVFAAIGATAAVAAAVASLGCDDRALKPPPPSPPATSASAAASASPPVGDCPSDMVRLDDGTFSWHGQVSVKSFCLHRSEVTVGQYAACVRAGSCTEPDRGGACTYGAPDQDDHPINCIDHAQAAALCSFVGARLPTAVEWRWAARGTRAGTTYPWGSAEPNAQACWSGQKLRHETCRVGAFPASDSPEGLHDLAGNVDEWLATPVPRAGDAFEVAGGSFASAASIAFEWFPTDYRMAKVRSESVGVRCAADLGHASPLPAPVPAASVAPVAPVAPLEPAEAPAPVATNGACSEGMLLVPKGSFVPDGVKQPAAVSAFCIGASEVTVHDYAACVTAGRCRAPDVGGPCNWGAAGRDRHPINCVDYAEAETYCAWAHARLPTDLEWTWAARGTSAGSDYPWGAAAPAAQLCWSGTTKRRNTCPVGAFVAGDSPLGAHDLAGNVAEWTSDPFRGPSARVVRGGAFTDDNPTAVGAHVVSFQVADRRDERTGLRCVAKPGR